MIIYHKPATLMNRSGNAVRCCVDDQRLRLKRNPASLGAGDEVIVVTDDLGLPFGTCRLTSKGGHGGHNGLRDIENRLGSRSFTRLRFGIGPPAGGARGGGGSSKKPDVLGRFTGQEQQELPRLLDAACEYLRLYLHRGYDAAASVANTK
jgi:PTH1 family peptidyl-tRNA hydrolase|tara:strand:+ start:274 stop:723 length:450 start_codon:yes stop_codon:yes gene_type:complete